ncbi:unnamed protein product [Phytophthora fragariaefolia]|uniref:Unnamed protein product n=1 Tax=Phytophthora fragariaefolia TaxID=1490495 RepID=A0A9W6XY27_9STRA|nr:unnamed protein product [Phytophthora fragariaefolia]
MVTLNCNLFFYATPTLLFDFTLRYASQHVQDTASHGNFAFLFGYSILFHLSSTGLFKVKQASGCTPFPVQVDPEQVTFIKYKSNSTMGKVKFSMSIENQ